MKKILMAALFAMFAAATVWADVTAVTPVAQSDDNYVTFCKNKKSEIAKKNPKIIFLGDSITYFWETAGRGLEVLNTYFTNSTYNAVCFGYPGDHTENLLWRLQQGYLDGADPKGFVLLIGTNNSYHRPNEPTVDTASGVKKILLYLREHFPNARIFLHPILPTTTTISWTKRQHDELVNVELQKFADGDHIRWVDFYSLFMLMNGNADASKFVDGLHPNSTGYELWAQMLMPEFNRLLSETASVPAARATSRIAENGLAENSWEDTTLAWRNAIADDADTSYDLTVIGDDVVDGFVNGAGAAHFAELADGRRLLERGIAGDRTENVLWRIQYGDFYGYTVSSVALMAGANNLADDTVADIKAGVSACVTAIRSQQSTARVFLYSLLPQGATATDAMRVKVNAVNEAIMTLADGSKVIWVDVASGLVNEDGTLATDKISADGELTAAGYGVLAEELNNIFSGCTVTVDAPHATLYTNGAEVVGASFKAEAGTTYALTALAAEGWVDPVITVDGVEASVLKPSSSHAIAVSATEVTGNYQVNGPYFYDDFADAVAAAKAASVTTVKVVRDVTLAGTLPADANGFTLDLGGRAFNLSSFTVPSGATLAIADTGNTKGSIAGSVVVNGTLDLSALATANVSCTVQVGAAAVAAFPSDAGLPTEEPLSGLLVNPATDALITVGSNKYAYDGSAWVTDATVAIAWQGGTLGRFSSIADAVAYADSGSVVKIMDDCTPSANVIVSTTNKAVVVDGQGRTVNCNSATYFGTSASGCSLVISNLNMTATGSNGGVMVGANTSCTLVDCNLTGGRSIVANGPITIIGGSYTGTEYLFLPKTTTGKMTLKSGTYSGTMQFGAKAKMTIEGGKFVEFATNQQSADYFAIASNGPIFDNQTALAAIKGSTQSVAAADESGFYKLVDAGEEPTTYAVAISVANATLTIDGTTYASGATFTAEAGTAYTIAATAASGYENPVIKFGSTTIASGSSYTFTAAGTLTVTATEEGEDPEPEDPEDPEETDNVAKVTVGGVTTEYATLDSALAAATAGSTVALLADVSLDATITLKAGYTLDGNGYEITSSVNGFAIEVAGSTTGLVLTNVVLNANYKSINCGYKSEVALKDCTMTASGIGVSVYGATVTIDGGSYSSTDYGVLYVATYAGSLTVNSGTFSGPLYCVKNLTTINGGTFNDFRNRGTASCVSITEGGAKFDDATVLATFITDSTTQQVVDVGDGYYQIQAIGSTPTSADPTTTTVTAVEGAANTYAVTPVDGATTVSVTGATSGDTFVIDADEVSTINVDNVDGVTFQVVRTVNETTYDITPALTTATSTSYTPELADTTVAVTTGTNTEDISVAPEFATTAAGGEGSADPIAITDDSLTFTVKSIPGLKYTLYRRAAATSGEWEQVAEADAEAARLSLSATKTSDTSYFYKVEVGT